MDNPDEEMLRCEHFWVVKGGYQVLSGPTDIEGDWQVTKVKCVNCSEEKDF